ncbi:MAG: DUF1254 domain-containing protein [Thermomicrobiales bacterium]
MTDPIEMAVRAYIYGYPMVFDIDEVVEISSSGKMAASGPINRFGHATVLGRPSDTFVSINNDTLYSIANCDVTNEPLVLHLPAVGDRYRVMQFVDAWTNNFAYLGTRATGNGEGFFLLAGPNWTGDVPQGMTLIQAPTNVFSIVGRHAVDGAADIPNVVAVQEQTWLTPLSVYPHVSDGSDRKLGDWDVAPFDTRVGEDLVFWEKFRSWLKLFPPPAEEKPFVDRLAPLGLLSDESPYVDPDPALAETLKAAQAKGMDTIVAAGKQGGAKVNGWSSAAHLFDYNLYRLGPGTIDAPEWKLTDSKVVYAVRAVAANGGLWGNHGYEAYYAWAFVDGDGNQLNGANNYVMHFDTMPPAKAFWSITMYNTPKYYLVENPIDRYSIGDRTPGLQMNDDGSLDIYLQREAPADPKQQANWLPTPEGDFRPLVRIYLPEDSVLDGSYELPAIERASASS